MRKNKIKSSSVLDADGRKEERYVRESEQIRQRRESLRRSWQEISQIGKRGLY